MSTARSLAAFLAGFLAGYVTLYLGMYLAWIRGTERTKHDQPAVYYEYDNA